MIRRLLATAACLCMASSARAADYGAFIDVESEEDLADLLSEGVLNEASYEALIELLADGVDLNESSRETLYALPNLTYADVDAILDYRDQAGRIADPAALVGASALTERKLGAIAVFIVIEAADSTGPGVRGRLRYRAAYVAGQSEVPSMWLGARLSAFRYLDAGVVGLLSRTRVAEVRYDPNRGGLSAEEPAIRAHMPKFFLQYESAKLHVLAGTFRIGFGQRLTLDNTVHYTPNGFRADDTIYYNRDLSRVCRQSQGELSDGPCTDEESNEYGAPDFRWSDRFRGVAFGLRDLEAGPGWVQAYVFASFQTHDVYQYELYDRGRCEDPRNDDDPACAAPLVYKRQSDPLAPTSRFSYTTLPNLYDELVVGANTSYAFGRRAHIGLTGYGASVWWLADGLDLDFQEWARTPFGGPYGAVGIDGAWGSGPVDLFGEFTRSFDSQPEGGGFGALLRSTATWHDHELEAALRYYDQDFANPHARPISAADEFEGLRARDEVGLRLKYSGRFDALRLRAQTDVWGQPSEEVARLHLKLRGDVDVTRWFVPGLWIEYRDKDLSDSGRTNCYDYGAETFEGEPVPCRGEKVQFTARLKFRYWHTFSLTAKYQHRLVDDGSDAYSTRFRQDSAAWLVMSYKPVDRLRFRARVAWLFEDIDSPDRLEHSVWATLEARWSPTPLFAAKLRYELYALVDDRDSTAERSPNPAHWLRLELESRF